MPPARLPSPPSPDFLARWAPVSAITGLTSLRAHIAPDVFALWEAWEKECGCECPIPYWSVAWPGAVVLARFLIDRPDLVKGRAVLDFGCGGALAGIAALRAGARQVVAADVDGVALEIARSNALANGVSLVLENRDLFAADASTIDAEVILAADLFYERSTARLTEEFLRSRAKKGALVFIADGERAFTPRTGVTLLHEERVPVNQPLEGVESRLVRVLRIGDLW